METGVVWACVVILAPVLGPVLVTLGPWHRTLKTSRHRG